ncbi:MAG: fumarylacetoacetate hydrolase family protein, partial [Anaerolineae bacterium]
RVYVSGELMQSSNTQNLIFSVPYLVSYLSQVMTLEPGDVILTGTPGGVGDVRTPPRYLQPGDEVRVEIAQLGVLRNPVTSEAERS